MAKTRKPTKAKEPVKIRFKQLSNGNKSIYLDAYTDGKRGYEFLKLYLVPEVDEDSRARNANALQVANAIKAQRIIEIANGRAGLSATSTRSKMLLFDWIEEYKKVQINKGVRGFQRQTNILENHLNAYRGKAVRLADIDKQYCLGFVDFLKRYVSPHTHKPLDNTTIKVYCQRFIALLNMAVKEDLIAENPFNKVQIADLIKDPAKQRGYLTIDEVKALVATPCRDGVVKSAFLFSCCCGLRISDVRALVWGNLKTDKGGCRAEIIVQKTQQPLYLPLSDEALKWLPERGNASDTDKVFGLRSCTVIDDALTRWAKDAGITKRVTFHISRHTFATTLLTAGADLYTTSKLLGHSNVGTTQIYAKIVNQKKVEAVNMLNNIFQ